MQTDRENNGRLSGAKQAYPNLAIYAGQRGNSFRAKTGSASYSSIEQLDNVAKWLQLRNARGLPGKPSPFRGGEPLGMRIAPRPSELTVPLSGPEL